MITGGILAGPYFQLPDAMHALQCSLEFYGVRKPMAVRSIRHKGLRRLWERNDAPRVPADSADKLRRMLAAINRSGSPETQPRPRCRGGMSTP
jgi:hypothetical protein